MPKTTTKAKKCRHCNERPADRRRGLCRRCHCDLSVRDRYQSESPNGKRDVFAADANRQSRIPDVPTRSLPRSAERQAEYARRAALGLSLHHPADGPVARVDLN
jgi:hypothetical protein